MIDDLFVKKLTDKFLEEDGIFNNFNYFNNLPSDSVKATLKFKSEMTVAGLPVFFKCFNNYLETKISYKEFLNLEGKEIQPQDLEFNLPFNIALTLERIALNLLNRMCSIATTTQRFKKKLNNDIAILDTRKTTPGLRAFEKYAVVTGGGSNHRFNQMDVFMIKDNHKSFFGGLDEAVKFFRDQKLFYNGVIVEIHDLNELERAFELGINHLMLDNFTSEQIDEAIKIKRPGATYEVSGGISFENIKNYDKNGIDALSIGMLTQNPLKVDISLKLNK